MFKRFDLKLLLLLGSLAPIAGCGNQLVDTLSISPPAQSVTVGQSVQFTATGTVGHGSGHPATTQDDTSMATWISSSPAVASINATGQATALSPGATTITASIHGYTGAVAAVATLTVTSSGSGVGVVNGITGLTIMPSSITVGNLQDTGQFLAVATYSGPPYVKDVTDEVTWVSSSPDVFPVDSSNGTNTGTSGGIVTAYGSGNAVIIAEEKDASTGEIQTATATFACPLVIPTATSAGSCYPGSQAPALKATITVYNEGLNTTNWLVTAPSATGTPDVIHCGPGWAGDGETGGSVCSAPYPFNSTGGTPTGTTPVVLAAPAQAGVAFGGWSYNCTPSDKNGVPLSPPTITAAGPNYCLVNLTPANPNVSVGAIFNNSN